MNSSFVGLGNQVRSLFQQPKKASPIPARPRLGILSFGGGARFMTACVCLKRSTPEGREKLSKALNAGGQHALQELNFMRQQPQDRDKFSPADKREIRECFGCGRPPKDKTRKGIELHRALVEAVNVQAREAAHAKSEAAIHARP